MGFIPQVPGGIYGTGEEQNWLNGVPQRSSFNAMSPWYTTPTNWYSKIDANGQIFVSPTWDFSAWVFAAKIDWDGGMKFQFPFGNRGAPLTQFTQTFPPVTYPPPVVVPQILLFSGTTPQVFPGNQAWPALAYNVQSELYGWDVDNLLWIAISSLDGLNVTPDPASASDSGSGQIIYFPSGMAMFPGQLNAPAIGYDDLNDLYLWSVSQQLWLPIVSTSGTSISAINSYNAIAGQLTFGGSNQNANAPANQNAPSLYYSTAGTVTSWNPNAKNQIPIIS